MKCVCVQKGQIRYKGKILYVKPGEVLDCKKCPPLFDPAEEASVDFLRDDKDALMVKKWRFSEVQTFFKAAFGAVFEKVDGESKEEIIDRILDTRYRLKDVPRE